MAGKKKRICFYCSSLARGGTERVIVNLAEHFHKIGYRVFIVTQIRSEAEYPISSDITRILSDLTTEEIGRNRVINFLNRLKKLRRIFKVLQPDIVFACVGKNNFMALTASAFLKTKVVVSVRAEPCVEYYTKLMRFLAKTMFIFADGIVLQTKQAGEFFPGPIRRKAVILPNSLNPRFQRPRYEGKREKEIVAVGRLDENKNHAMLIRAFGKIVKDFPDYRVVIYGDGTGHRNLEKLIGKLHLSDKVVLAGRTDAVEEKIYKSSLFVLTSDAEGMPNALIEAMALGLPVISTDCPCGGPRELIQDGVNGYLIPVRDEEALYERLRYCLTHMSEMNEIGRRAAEIQKRLNPEKVNKKWEAYFNSVMNSKGKRC